MIGLLFTPVVSIGLVLLSTWTYDRLQGSRAGWLFRAPRLARPGRLGVTN
ncbi:hypothetical protein NKG05_21115 [Oerskovia sp. M15]